MQPFKTIVSGALAVCLAFASLVGLSPNLHRLIEHGGQGAAHTHSGTLGQSARHGHRHQDGQWHEHRPERPRVSGVFVHRHESGSRNVSVVEVWQSVVRLLERGLRNPSGAEPSPDGPGHEHHSLAQILASGVVDGPPDVALALVPPAAPMAASIPEPVSVLVSDWDPLTLGRGPPFLRS